MNDRTKTKNTYETPKIDVIHFASEDVMTASSIEVTADPNAGEWDPQ